MYRTAEFVSPKHPDKLCDQVSDYLVDMYLARDSNSRCAIEVCGGHGKICVTGEVSSKQQLKREEIEKAVSTITGIYDTHINIVHQSPEIAKGVDKGGAGDQGIMVGYACNENEQHLPQEYYFARELNRYVYGYYPFDGKTQVTIDEDNKELYVICSFQNAKQEQLRDLCFSFFKRFPEYSIKNLKCNPAGDWEIGGFQADAGLTGRKIVVDAYGPRIPVGGGAFSGKDATKVDRSAAYMARYIAKQCLIKNNAKEVYVYLSYAIGYNQPIQATVVVDGVEHTINDYDLSPRGIIEKLDLKKPIYYETAKWGHFGNGNTWEL